MFTKEELKLLNTNKGLEYLLRSENPDFRAVTRQLLYRKELVDYQTKLINVQNWVVEKNKRVLILLEGREFAGKGATIRALTEHLNPRSIRTVALRKPTPQEKGQWYFLRYAKQIPERGEMVFFDRSWYNRALVEPVNGFCTKKEYKRFMKEVNHFERMLSEDGIRIIKIYLDISKEEQQRRIEYVRQNRLRRWELTPVDLQAVELWDEYTKYETKMLEKTNTKKNPWHIIEGDNSGQARLQTFAKILELLPIDPDGI